MNIFLNNTTKYSINAKINSIEYLLEPNQTRQLSANDNDTIVLSITDNIANKTTGEKLKDSLKNLVLNVSCSYIIKNLTENENIQIVNEIYEFKENALLLPFAYHYLKANMDNTQFRLVSCNADNAKAIKKIYFIFALLGDGGFDFLLNIFSISFQMHRIKRLCNNDKILSVIKNDKTL